MKNLSYEYGECTTCGSTMQEKCIQQDFWVRGELIVVENVPAGVCPQCGEKVVRAEIGRRIADILGNREAIATARRIAVPAINLDVWADSKPI